MKIRVKDLKLVAKKLGAVDAEFVTIEKVVQDLPEDSDYLAFSFTSRANRSATIKVFSFSQKTTVEITHTEKLYDKE